MLQFFHEKIKGVFAWIIVSLIAFTFALLGVQSYMGSGQGSKSAAAVNGAEITDNVFRRAFERARAQQQHSMGAVISDQLVLDNMKQQLLEQLITNKILVQEAEHIGLAVSSEQISRIIQSAPSLQVDGKFSEDRLRQVLSSNYYSLAAFSDKISQDVLIGQLQSAISRTSFVLPREIRTLYTLGEETRDIQYVKIPASNFSAGSQISAASIKSYYDAHHAEFTEAEKVKVQYLTLSLDNISKNVVILDDEVKQYYNENKINYMLPAKLRLAHILIAVPSGADKETEGNAKQKATQLYKQLKDGADFAALAKLHSADVVTKNKGGELPWVALGTFDTEMERASLRITEKGGVAKPVRTQYGFEVIKLLDKQLTKQRPFSDVSKLIKEGLVKDAAQKQFAEQSDELASLAFTTPDSLKEAASKLHLTLKTSGSFTRTGLPKGVAANKIFVHAAFNDDVLINRNNSDLINLSPNEVAVLRVIEHKPSSLRPLEATAATIKAKLKRAKMQRSAMDYARRLQKAHLHKAELKALLEKHELTWQTQKGIKRDLTGEVDAALTEAAFRISPDKSANQSLVTELDADHAAFVTLLKRTPGDFAKLTGKRLETLSKNIATIQGRTDFDVYLQGLKAASTIERHIKK